MKTSVISLEKNETYLARRGEAIMCHRKAAGFASEITAMNLLVTMLDSEITEVTKSWTISSQDLIALAKVDAINKIRTWAGAKIYDLSIEIEKLNSCACLHENRCKKIEQEFAEATADGVWVTDFKTGKVIKLKSVQKVSKSGGAK